MQAKRLIGEVAIAATMLCGIAFLLYLGNWQAQRLSWKEHMIQRAEQRSIQAPTEIDSPAITAKPEEWQYRQVTITGHFLPEKEAFVYTILSEPKGQSGGPGWNIITPFQLLDGSFVLVNRGFVPVNLMADKTAWSVKELGTLTLTGYVILPEPRGMFAVNDNFQTREFYTRDIAAMAQAMGITAPAFLVERIGKDAPPLPQAGETLLSFANNHLSYALTWFSLAATLAVFFMLWIGRKFKSRRDKRAKNR